MKIIFLDIDGVLNCQDVFKAHRKIYDKTGKRPPDIDDILIDNLEKIVKSDKDIYIVLSSSWRSAFFTVTCLNNTLPKLLPKKSGYDPEALFLALNKRNIKMISKTGHDKEGSRGREICEWLDIHAQQLDVESFIIIDDEVFDIDKYLPSSVFVKTSFYKDGLNEKLADEAIKKINTKQDIDKLLEIYRKEMGENND